MVSEERVSSKLNSIRRSAERRGKEFNLNAAYVRNLLNQTHCAYSGRRFTNKSSESLTFERWNNQLGYVRGNVIPVMKKFNLFRDDKELDELLVDRHHAKIESSFALSNAAHELIHQQKKMISACKNSMVTRYTKIKALEVATQKTMSRQKNRVEDVESCNDPDVLELALKKIARAENQIMCNNNAIAKLNKQISDLTDQVSRALTIIYNLKSNKKIALSRSQAKNRLKSYDVIIPRIERLFQASDVERFNLERGLPMDTKLAFWEMLYVKFGIMIK